MALAKRPAAPYDGLKKHDLPLHSQTWQSAPRMRPATIFRKRRLFVALVALVVVYLFIKYLPTDVPSVSQRIDSRTGRSQGRPVVPDLASKKSGDETAGGTLSAKQLYDGPVKFYRLASSLRPHLYNEKEDRDSVLFMLYDLQTAASFTGVACEMALYNKTNVHMGLMTTRDASIEDIMSVSGLKVEDCPISWHDARPDYNSKSSPARQAVVIKAAVSHMHTTLKPSVVIIDQRQASNTHFKTALQEKLDSVRTPLSIIPNDAHTSMSWITTLDGKGLSLLNQNQIDIIIQPYKQSAGSLIRLLESIKSAHYTGLPLPRITVELPHTIDPFALRYLENFHWPHDSPISQSKLILRRRIDNNKLTPAIATLRTLESFYPPTTPASHVLVLSPDVELSPSYLQYLYYLTLTYKYGNPGLQITSSLTGISLDLPEHTLDNKTPFLTGKEPQSALTLHQSPSAHAALYFGDHWVELQSYASLRLSNDPSLSLTVPNSIESTISPAHPSWLQLSSELLQLRNNYILYPAFADIPGKKLITIHTESTQSPEEFWTEPTRPTPDSIPLLEDSDTSILTGDHEHPDLHANMLPEPTSSTQSIQSLLNLKGRETLPDSKDIPLFSAAGHATDWDMSRTESEAYADKVSLELGGCRSLGERDDEIIGRLEYLFC